MLINCVAYQNGRKLADIPVGEIHLFVTELRSPYGYPLTLGVMAAIDVYLFYRFRKAKWL